MDKDDDPVIPVKLKELVITAKRERAEILILTDSNAHSPLWDPTYVEKHDKAARRGKIIEEYIAENRLRCLNRGNRATYVRYNAQTKVDITLTSQGLVDKIQHWAVTDRVAFSDHCSIEFVLRLNLPPPEGKRNFRKTKFSVFTPAMEEESLKAEE